VILRPGDKVEIREKSREIKEIVASLAAVDKRPVLSWLELDKANFAGTFKGVPVRDEMNEPAIREQYVVEYYSR
jgi:small subunit ribosomal protein S4